MSTPSDIQSGQQHSTYVGYRGGRAADGSHPPQMPFARCACGWEGPSHPASRRSRAVQDGLDHCAERAAAQQAPAIGREEMLIDPDCQAGKCGSCVGGPCEHRCHYKEMGDAETVWSDGTVGPKPNYLRPRGGAE